MEQNKYYEKYLKLGAENSEKPIIPADTAVEEPKKVEKKSLPETDNLATIHDIAMMFKSTKSSK